MRELRDKWHPVCCGSGSWQWGETCAECCCCPTSVLLSTTALLLCYLHGLLSRAETGISNHMPDAVGFWLVGSNKINESFMVLHVSLCNCFQEASGIAICRPVSGLTLMNLTVPVYELHSQCDPMTARQAGTSGRRRLWSFLLEYSPFCCPQTKQPARNPRCKSI